MSEDVEFVIARGRDLFAENPMEAAKQTKQCSGCLRNLQWSKFAKDAHGAYGIKSRCRECIKKLDRERRKNKRKSNGLFWNRALNFVCHGPRGRKKIRAKKISQSFQSVTYWAKILATKYLQQNKTCPLSGLRLGRDFEIDHIIPESRGGNHEADNIRLTNPWANRAKTNLHDSEFIANCIQVARHNDPEIDLMLRRRERANDN